MSTPAPEERGTAAAADGALSAAAAPARREPLGRDFRTLWVAAMASNLADGLGRTAVPLLAATLTTDPFAIAVLGAVVFLPWLLFGIPAGILVDRLDRRYSLAVANVLRVGSFAALALAVATGSITIGLLYVAAFLVGLGETVTDNATTAMVPATVTPRQLDRANGRIQLAQVSLDSFVASPIAGLLFAVVIVLPLWSAAAGYALAIGLVLLLPKAVGDPLRDARRAAEAEAEAAASTEVGVAAAEAVAESAAAPVGPVAGPVPVAERTPLSTGLRFLWQHRYLRAVAVYVSAVGFLLSFAQATTLLLLLVTLEVPEAFIGFALAGVGVGALLGSILAPLAVERFGRGLVMFGGCALAAVTILATGLMPNVWLAVPVYAVSSFGIAAWNVPWGSLRQELVPREMLGSVVGAIRTVSWGLFPVATLLGGLVGRWDLRAPFWIGGASLIVVVAAWAPLILRATSVTAEHRAGAEARS